MAAAEAVALRVSCVHDMHASSSFLRALHACMVEFPACITCMHGRAGARLSYSVRPTVEQARLCQPARAHASRASPAPSTRRGMHVARILRPARPSTQTRRTHVPGLCRYLRRDCARLRRDCARLRRDCARLHQDLPPRRTSCRRSEHRPPGTHHRDTPSGYHMEDARKRASSAPGPHRRK